MCVQWWHFCVRGDNYNSWLVAEPEEIAVERVVGLASIASQMLSKACSVVGRRSGFMLAHTLHLHTAANKESI